MNNAIKYFFVMILMLLSSQTIAQKNEGPFGVHMGMSIEEIKAAIPADEIIKTENGLLFTKTAPTPIPILDGTYVFLTTPETGLCRSIGTSKDSSSESEIKNTYEILKSALTEKYGKPKVYEKAFNEYLGFLMSLATEDRIHASGWELEPGNEIEQIGVDIQGVDAFTARVRVSYQYNNFDQCLKIINKQRTSGL